jgi:EpsI family protein
MVHELVMDAETKNVLRADDYLSRDYARSPGEVVNLFVAYFKSQRSGQTPHSPKNCLPGSGWVWTDSDTIRVTVAGRAAPLEINRYIVSRGENKAVVLYWYQSRDRVVASEYKAAAFVAWDALHYNRTDTALVRVVTPMNDGRSDTATESGIDFIQSSFATLRTFFPLR